MRSGEGKKCDECKMNVNISFHKIAYEMEKRLFERRKAECFLFRCRRWDGWNEREEKLTIVFTIRFLRRESFDYDVTIFCSKVCVLLLVRD